MRWEKRKKRQSIYIVIPLPRLLGEHVPYAIEAWPEGGQRHLSAESGLYGRIITEGLFGIRPTGFNSFILTPRLPEVWSHMALRKIGHLVLNLTLRSIVCLIIDFR